MVPAGRISLSMHTYIALKIKRALSEIDFIGRCSLQAGSPWFAPSEGDYWWYSSITGPWNSLSWRGPIRLSESSSWPPKDPTRSIVLSPSPVWGCVGRNLTPFPLLSHLPCPIRRGNQGQGATGSFRAQCPAASLLHGKVTMAVSRQVRACIRLHSERKQIAEKCTFRQFGLKHEKWN